MATSYPTISVPAGWTDIAAEEPGIASAPGVMVQNRGRQNIAVFFGGASEPTEEDDGEVLGRFKRHFDKSGSAHIWVKGPGHVAVVVDDVNPIPVGGSAFDDLSDQIASLATQTAAVADALNSPAGSLPAGEEHLGQVGGSTVRISASFTRPGDTTAYASGDLVANNTVAGSVAPLTFTNVGRIAGSGGMIRRVRLRKSGVGIANASFRLHLYNSAPTAIQNGDNGAWLTAGQANYMGSLDVICDKVFTDGAAGNGIPTMGSEINFTSQTIYGLIEARGAYTPGNAEVFDVILEVIQN